MPHSSKEAIDVQTQPILRFQMHYNAVEWKKRMWFDSNKSQSGFFGHCLRGCRYSLLVIAVFLIKDLMVVNISCTHCNTSNSLN